MNYSQHHMLRHNRSFRQKEVSALISSRLFADVNGVYKDEYYVEHNRCTITQSMLGHE